MSSQGTRADARSRFLTEADRAETAGDLVGAAVALRNHLERHPGDGPARLHFARLLLDAGERAAARQALGPLEGAGAEPGSPVGRQAERTLAEIDEADGALASAALRWERLLADDIDDAQAARAPRATAGPIAAKRWSRRRGSRPCAFGCCARSDGARRRPCTWRATKRSIMG